MFVYALAMWAVLSSEAHVARASGPRPKRGPAQDGVTLFFNSFLK